MKKILCLLLACLSLTILPLTAFAHDVPEVDRDDGSIHVSVRYAGEPVPGGKLTAIRVGYIYEENGDYTFRRFGDDKPLEDIQSASAAEEMAAYVAQNDYPFEAQTVTVGEDGVANFLNLKTGLYLIRQDAPAPGYTTMNPFLVSVPYMEFGKYLYHVSALIKSEINKHPEPTEPPTEPPTVPEEPTEPPTVPEEPTELPTVPEEPTVPPTEPEETTQPSTAPTEPEPTRPAPTKPDPDKLPQTGQMNWPVPVLAVIGFALLVAGWGLRFGCRKKTQGE